MEVIFAALQMLQTKKLHSNYEMLQKNLKSEVFMQFKFSSEFSSRDISRSEQFNCHKSKIESCISVITMMCSTDYATIILILITLIVIRHNSLHILALLYFRRHKHDIWFLSMYKKVIFPPIFFCVVEKFSPLTLLFCLLITRSW